MFLFIAKNKKKREQTPPPPPPPSQQVSLHDFKTLLASPLLEITALLTTHELTTW